MKLSKSVALSLLAVPAVLLPLVASHAAPAKPPVLKTQGPAIPKGIGGVWNLDPVHSQIGFSVTHLMLNEVHGTFDQFEGTAKIDQADFRRSSVNFTAKIASVDTRVEARDNHLKSADFFDAAKYPTMTFKSQRIVRGGDGFRAIGLFTLHGVTRTIIIPFHASGPIKDPFGFSRASLTAKFDLNRQDYGVKWNQKLDSGGTALADIVHINLDLEATKEGTGPKKKPA